MVQTANHYDLWEDRRWENEESLKKYLAAHYQTVTTREFSLGQTTTAAAVELFEDSGETVTFAAAAATVLVWQKTDQVGTDGGATVTIEYSTIAGVVTTVSVALDGVDTTTEVAVCADFYRLRKMTCSLLCADEILLGTTGGVAIHGVIKVGCWEAANSRYYTPLGYRAFLVDVQAIGPHTDPSTITIAYTAAKETLQRQWTRADYVSTTWYSNTLLWELEPLYDLTLTILKNADANHGVMTVRFKIIEAA